MLPYYTNPKNDFEKLFNYQYEWIENKDKQAEAKFWELSRKVIQRMVIGVYQSRSINWKWDTVQEKTSVAQEYVLRRFYKGTGYYIRSSMGNALRNGVIHAIDYRTKADLLIVNILKMNPVKYNPDFVFEDGNGAEALFN